MNKFRRGRANGLWQIINDFFFFFHGGSGRMDRWFRPTSNGEACCWGLCLPVRERGGRREPALLPGPDLRRAEEVLVADSRGWMQRVTPCWPFLAISSGELAQCCLMPGKAEGSHFLLALARKKWQQIALRPPLAWQSWGKSLLTSLLEKLRGVTAQLYSLEK